MDVQIFVQNVKEFCKKKGVKPTIACEESGAGKNLLNHIESRGSIPSVAKVQMLAEYLGVTTSELLGEKKEPTAQDDGLSDGERTLMTLFRQLTPDQQEMVIRMVQAAADKL
ncbi:helix-turn-helix domain-containing protein [uncultured Flavonifractor sp.]|uniref:helix-turn-helix domain-containing protein n=1 Tax=uncultured Flavonifractor sp. TaxID=1193534 RepID=UPI00260ED992|nr:helix-turn-helix transcriptional regulator [uncultured Flavonifractor sp.]